MVMLELSDLGEEAIVHSPEVAYGRMSIAIAIMFLPTETIVLIVSLRKTLTSRAYSETGQNSTRQNWA